MALLPLIAEPRQVQELLGDDRLLIVDLSDPIMYQQRHVPGAINLPYSAIIRAEPPAMGLMPAEEQLSQVLGAIGLTADAHVVAYDSEGNGRASRLLWTLDVLGHDGLSLIDGGLNAWIAEGLRVEGGTVDPRPSDYRASIARPERAADAAYLLEHLEDPGIVVLDTRSAPEYQGVDRRAARAGHIPGAVNRDWVLNMDPARQQRFKPAPDLAAQLAELGVTPDKEVIVHCQTHHRSAHTYVLLKSLGYPRVRGYAGSWSEWGNLPDTPVE